MKRCSVLSVLIFVSQVQITMEQTSIQEWTDLRTGVWTSPEPPDPAGLQEAWYTILLTLELEIHLHLKAKVSFDFRFVKVTKLIIKLNSSETNVLKPIDQWGRGVCSPKTQNQFEYLLTWFPLVSKPVRSLNCMVFHE